MDKEKLIEEYKETIWSLCERDPLSLWLSYLGKERCALEYRRDVLFDILKSMGVEIGQNGQLPGVEMHMRKDEYFKLLDKYIQRNDFWYSLKRRVRTVLNKVKNSVTKTSILTRY